MRDINKADMVELMATIITVLLVPVGLIGLIFTPLMA